MGCSPSLLLEHIHRSSITRQASTKITVHAAEKEPNRKVSLPLTPEEDAVDVYKNVQEEKHGLILPPSRSPLKLLLVFPTSDATAEALRRASDKLAFETTCTDSFENALEVFQTAHYDLIIIDSRSPKLLDFDTLCRSIRNTKGFQHIVVVSVVKKSSFEKDDVFVMSHMESGFNRCLVESNNVVVWMNELVQLKNGDCRMTAQIGTAQVLYAAVNISKDPVIVTDDIGRMQFLNGASEKLLGFRQEETLGRTISDQLANDSAQMNLMMNNLTRGKTWQGNVSFKRKSLDPVSTMCKSLPIISMGRMPTHFLIVIDTPTTYDSLQARGSIHSLRKGSLDIKSVNSDYYRRTSLAKLPLEAPITKILSLIYEVQGMQGGNSASALLLEKAIEMLKCTELYSPTVKEEVRAMQEEPVASDLIGALLANSSIPTHSVNSRRSSNDSSIFRVSKAGIRMKNSPTGQIDKLLDSALQWDFNIFKLEIITDHRPLLYLGYNLFLQFDVATTLNCEPSVLYSWLLKVEANYHLKNPYHNSTHAADVMQSVAGFLEKERMKAIMDPMDEATALIAAAAHDIDHPGRSSAFLANSDNPLSILYNDITILESHHAALTFKLTLGDDRCNIFKNLDRESYKIARYNVVDMILATEMTKHFEHLAKFVNVFCSKAMDADETGGEIQITLPENITLVKRIMIKCADVSNPTRPFPICVEWARRIAEEYFQQTDEEKAKGLPVVMPMFDRSTCSIPKSQVGFIDFIINDMIDAWNAFIDMPELVTNMRNNYLKWKEFNEQGFSTLSDIKKLQESNSVCKLHI